MSYNKKAAKAKQKRQEWEDHTERRLRDNFDVYSQELEKTQEGLLEEGRTNKNEEKTMEALLESNRTGSRHAVTEKQMDTEKPSFGNVMRQALETGQIPPLEAQRLENNPVEDEKYEAANENKKRQSKEKK